jgi:hypothetical protein
MSGERIEDNEVNDGMKLQNGWQIQIIRND